MTDTDKLYKIKPLTWITDITDGSWANTPFGNYVIASDRWSFTRDMGQFPCTSIEAGKAAAEAHWRERILPMLTEVE